MRHRPGPRHLVALAVAAIVSLVALSLPVAAEPVTYSATITVPAPPASNFAGANGGGDGWAVALSSTQLFNVFHHAGQTTVNCHNQSDATDCWSGPKTVTDELGGNYSTSIAPGLYLDQATGKLYVPVSRNSDLTAGVLCIDTTKPASATGPELYCGFTQLSGVGDAPPANGAGVAAPIQIGSKWYIFNAVAGDSSGTRNTLLCFDLDAKIPCAGQPFPVDKGGIEPAPFSYPYPSGVVGSRVIVQIRGDLASVLACFDAATGAECAGVWPVAVPGVGGSPFPMLDVNGVVVGVCAPVSGLPCFDLQGAPVPTPAGVAAAVSPSPEYGGPSVTIGARVYVPDPQQNQIDCVDYSLDASCANFPKTFSNLYLMYTVNPDPQRPACLWVNADSGAAQIQNFDAFSGGPCGTGAIRVLSSSVVVPNDECLPASYQSLQVLEPARSGYTSGSIDFQDGSGNPIPGFATHPLDGTGTADLTDLALSTKTALPQFLITLEGVQGSLGSVSVKLVWKGEYSASCEKQGTTITGRQAPPPAPGPGPAVPPHAGYRLAAVDGGVFSFGDSPFAGSLGGAPLNGRIVGIAETAPGKGYWLVGRDGGIFAFGDAKYFGSLPELGIKVNDVVGIAATPGGQGYYLVSASGGVFAFGNAVFRGAALDVGVVTTDVKGLTPAPDGRGYWLVKGDGGVLSFGDVTFPGSVPGRGIAVDDVIGLQVNKTGNGYWIVERNGTVHTFGDALALGSPADLGITPKPIVAVLATTTGRGYWLVEATGGVLSFGDAPFMGSLALTAINAPLVGAAT